MHKNKIFINKIKKKIGNNQSYTLINNEIKEKELKKTDKKTKLNTNLSIEDKLKELFNRNGYIFNVDVQIITNNQEYDTKIASKVGNHLITLDNDIININDIKDIIIKN